MKDPLQVAPTPYEILGVPRGATDLEIDRAFKQGLGRPKDLQRLTNAKLALQRPLERGMLDLFLYDPETVGALTPSPLKDVGALAPEQRAETARAWEAQLGRMFPDLAVTHSLAVLWYWWATHAATGNGAASRGPSARERWERAIGYWAMIAANDEFWSRAGWLPGNVVAPLRQALVERLRTQLRELGAEHRGLELTLTSEVKAAQELAAAGLRTAHGKVSCGPLVLTRFKMLDNVRAQIDKRLRRHGSARMSTLRDMLSPYAPIRALLEAGKPRDALTAIGALPADEQRILEVAALRVRALQAHGRQLAEVDRVDEALSAWAEALAGTSDASLTAELRIAIATMCRTRAAALAQDHDAAMTILERGRTLISDESLDLALAELLTERGIKVFLAAQKEVTDERRITSAMLGKLERGLADLEQAEALGGERALEQARIAREYLAQAKDGVLDIPDEVKAELARATQAANGGDWDAAIEAQRKALKLLGHKKGPDFVRKNLAILLANRAIEKANAAMKMLESVNSRVNFQVSLEVERMEQSRANTSGQDICHRCFKFKWQGGDWFTYAPPGAGVFTLCGACAQAMKALEAPRAPNRAAQDLLGVAERDLAEAMLLDSSEALAKHLDDVRELRRQLGAQPAARLPDWAARAAAAAPGGAWFWVWPALAAIVGMEQCMR